jgi:hypothetical protein
METNVETRKCTCVPVTAAGTVVKDPYCQIHGAPRVTFEVMPGFDGLTGTMVSTSYVSKHEENKTAESEAAAIRLADRYAAAARVIGLHLREFCDESLPYDEMIAEAARRASDEVEQLRALVREAFNAGYHCNWGRGKYCFDPAMRPGDPDGAYWAWWQQTRPGRLDPDTLEFK